MKFINEITQLKPCQLEVCDAKYLDKTVPRIQLHINLIRTTSLNTDLHVPLHSASTGIIMS